MSAPPPPKDLGATIEAAQQEAVAHDAAAAQMRQAQERSDRRPPRGLPAGAALLLALLLGTLWWAWRHPVPSELDLQRGRELTLQLAAQAVQDELLRTGQPPSDLATLLPAAAGVELRATDEQVELRLPGAASPIMLARPRP